eukprot:gene31619-39059_t
MLAAAWGAHAGAAETPPVVHIDCSATAAGAGSLQQPLNSLGQLNGIRFQPGTRILFKRGATCYGSFQPMPGSSGAPGAPIVVDSYGDAALPRPAIAAGCRSSRPDPTQQRTEASKRPEGVSPYHTLCTAAGGQVNRAALYLFNVEHWEINGLELIDGQGNFGSRDGDGAAAMRYTEARLSRITSLLLDEIDEGTVDFMPNYDGSTEEPRQLPARLPFALLNGASGIAVGLATEIPSHNLREIADACIALIKTPTLSQEELLAIVPGPDYPGGGQIISSAGDIADAYRTGRGSLKVRARWKIEDMARGQWQLVVNELPPGVSTQKVLEEIEEITNPKVKAGKKALSQDQTQLKASMLAVLDVVRDESSKDAPVRLVFEPKTGKTPQQELITALLAHTSLESSAPINLTMVGLDGRPTQKSLRQMLEEWIAFRQTTITRRTQHRLNKVLERIHILEGRQIVLLNIDEVIAIIREASWPGIKDWIARNPSRVNELL